MASMASKKLHFYCGRRWNLKKEKRKNSKENEISYPNLSRGKDIKKLSVLQLITAAPFC